MPPIAGVRLATAEAGIRYKGRTDVLYVALDEGTRGGGRLHALALPVGARSIGAASNLAGGTARALVVNSGNANAFTGLKGREAVALTAEIAAEAAGCRPGRDRVPGLHRRHRRAARRDQVPRRAGGLRRPRRARTAGSTRRAPS